MIGIFIGRFQPLHLGHFESIRWICRRVDMLYIAISESHDGDADNNPYSREQREQMIKESLDAGHIDNYKLIYIPDFDTVDEWIDETRKQAPDFNTVFTGNPWVKARFEEGGFKTQQQPIFQPEEYNGTKIRQFIRDKKPWEHLVPEAVARIIRKTVVSSEAQRQ